MISSRKGGNQKIGKEIYNKLHVTMFSLTKFKYLQIIHPYHILCLNNTILQRIIQLYKIIYHLKIITQTKQQHSK